MCVPFAVSTSSRPFGLYSSRVEMSVEMGHAHSMEISLRGFDASHLLSLSNNRFFRLNGKQPQSVDEIKCACHSSESFSTVQ